MDDPVFLTAEETLRLHDIQLQLYGGLPGLRDPGMLESAVAMPAMRFDGEFLHSDIFEMAAAHLFHLAKDHPFCDGNKRVALHAAFVFLRMNGYRLTIAASVLYDLTISVAEGTTDKHVVARRFRKSSTPTL
jgi:death-on-curing protein